MKIIKIAEENTAEDAIEFYRNNKDDKSFPMLKIMLETMEPFKNDNLYIGFLYEKIQKETQQRQLNKTIPQSTSWQKARNILSNTTYYGDLADNSHPIHQLRRNFCDFLSHNPQLRFKKDVKNIITRLVRGAENSANLNTWDEEARNSFSNFLSSWLINNKSEIELLINNYGGKI